MLRPGSGSGLLGLTPFFFFVPDLLDISKKDVVDFLFLLERQRTGDAPWSLTPGDLSLLLRNSSSRLKKTQFVRSLVRGRHRRQYKVKSTDGSLQKMYNRARSPLLEANGLEARFLGSWHPIIRSSNFPLYDGATPRAVIHRVPPKTLI